MSEFDLFIEQITNPKFQQARLNKIDLYKSEISKFFKSVLDYLKEYIEKGKISCNLMNNWSINDEELGKFNVEWMQMKLGMYDISFTPHSPSLVGAFGRIDMNCRSNHIMFVLTYKNLEDISEIPDELRDKEFNEEELEWKYVDNNLSGRLKKLTKEVFLKTFIQVVNGN